MYKCYTLITCIVITYKHISIVIVMYVNIVNVCYNYVNVCYMYVNISIDVC